MPVTIKRKDIRFDPDPKRVIARFFSNNSPERAVSLFHKIMRLSDAEILINLNYVLRKFCSRHRNITKIFEKNFIKAQEEIEYFYTVLKVVNKRKALIIKKMLDKINENTGESCFNRKLLIGSYFTMEYSIECAAFFNPSMIEDPDQSNLTEKGQKRIIVSFRGTGEGHISSIVFRSGIIDKNNDLFFDPIGRLLENPNIVKRHRYDKMAFLKKIEQLNPYARVEEKEKKTLMDIFQKTKKIVMDPLKDQFLYGELQASISNALKREDLTKAGRNIIDSINWLADSHYEISFSRDTLISERVIFPISYSESNGIEDARFVRFVDDDGTVVYYATYTAYNGYVILPKLLMTKDFCNFKIMPLNGQYAQNKGMALFPRKIKGKYVMLSRIEGMSNFIMVSDKINLWQNARKIKTPLHPWEFVQIGNSGSPLEIKDEGWLLLTHGVGPMRQYCLGATLLDLDNPTRVIAHLKEPLMSPNEKEREGYVPNVVYSCGSIIHNNELIIPYGMSDYASSFATVPLDELLYELKKS
ncbi:MAG: glycoside hydrolase family 130 protein [Candidatus Omnitrophota bacterium]